MSENGELTAAILQLVEQIAKQNDFLAQIVAHNADLMDAMAGDDEPESDDLGPLTAATGRIVRFDPTSLKTGDPSIYTSTKRHRYPPGPVDTSIEVGS